jgi:hypothetical protein
MHHRYRTAPALALALAAGLLAAAPAQAAPTASPSGQSDVNGDGYGDLVTASEAAVSGASGAGAVVVNTGSSSGVSAGRTQIVTQNSSGVPGAAEKDDEFGAALATGDLNGDGYTDVVAVEVEVRARRRYDAPRPGTRRARPLRQPPRGRRLRR